jgi:hypothetical protein
MEDVTFTNCNLGDFVVPYNAVIKGRNVTLSDSTPINPLSSIRPGTVIELEDVDGDPRVGQRWETGGTTEVRESDLRTGGADTIFHAEPGDMCGEYTPLLVANGYSQWAPATTSRDFSVYIKTENWTTQPTSTQLYLEVLYYDTASGSTRTAVVSTDTSVDATWTKFTASSIAPGEPGPIIWRVWCNVYEASGRTIQVDRRPVIE